MVKSFNFSISFSKPFKMLKRKLKLFVIFASFSIIQSYPVYLESTKVDDHFNFYSFESENDEKIPIAKKLKQSEIEDFCYISNIADKEGKNCGCFLFDENHVVTSAKCLME